MYPRRYRFRLLLLTFAFMFLCAGVIQAQFPQAIMNFEHASFTVAINPATNRLYVPQGIFFDAKVTVIDGDPASSSFHQVITHIDLPNDCLPLELAANPATNRIYVADDFGGRVLIVDGATNSLIGAVAVGPHPTGVAVNSVTNRIYIAAGSDIVVLDGNSNSVVATIPLVSQNHPAFRVAVNATTNRVYVTSLQGSITVVDGTNNSIVATIAGGSLPTSVAVNPVTDRIYVSNLGDATVSVIQGATNTIQANVLIGGVSNEVGVNSVTGRVFANRLDTALVVIDGRLSSPTYNSVLSSTSFPNRVTDLTVNSNTNLVYVMTDRLLFVFDASPTSATAALTSLIQWVASLNLAQGTANSLDSKLTNAQSALESVKGGDAATACNKLGSFINEAQAQQDKQQLTPTQVRELIVEAELIRSALGCQ